MGITPAQFLASGQRASGEPGMGVDTPITLIYNAGVNAGWNSLVVQRSHKPQVVGSNPTPAPTSLWRNW